MTFSSINGMPDPMQDPSRRAHYYGLARHMVGLSELGTAGEQIKQVRQIITGCQCEACKLAIERLTDVCATLLWAFENAGQIIGDKALEHIGREMRAHMENTVGSDPARRPG